MEVILTEDVKNLGLEGELHEVADGYARNFLLPQQKAVHANERTKEQFKQKEEEIEERRRKMIDEAQELADELEAVSIKINKAASEEGNLYGSVTQEDIVEALEDEGFEDLTEESIVIDEAIREIDTYTIRINLAGSVEAEVELEVAPS
ncbi:MAG: 50S ribosomal protein L9 [bacterium]